MMYWPVAIFYVPLLLFLKAKLVPAHFTSHKCGAQHTSGRCIWRKVALHRQVPSVLMNGFQLASCTWSSEAHILLENILFIGTDDLWPASREVQTVSASSESLVYCIKCLIFQSSVCLTGGSSFLDRAVRMSLNLSYRSVWSTAAPLLPQSRRNWKSVLKISNMSSLGWKSGEKMKFHY